MVVTGTRRRGTSSGPGVTAGARAVGYFVVTTILAATLGPIVANVDGGIGAGE